MLNPVGPRLLASFAAASRMRRRVAFTNSRRVGLTRTPPPTRVSKTAVPPRWRGLSHWNRPSRVIFGAVFTATGVAASRGRRCGTEWHRRFQFALIDLFEQVAPAAHTPQFELRVVVRVE